MKLGPVEHGGTLRHPVEAYAGLFAVPIDYVPGFSIEWITLAGLHNTPLTHNLFLEMKEGTTETRWLLSVQLLRVDVLAFLAVESAWRCRGFRFAAVHHDEIVAAG
jgi:hypothetical protein